MSNLFNHRGQMYDHGMVPVVDINDARNGILLHNGFHRSLDRGEIAFLKVCYLLSLLYISCNSSILLNRHQTLLWGWRMFRTVISHHIQPIPKLALPYSMFGQIWLALW
ncbi:hypothetical protein JVU11DRAFT_9623 [Chiua virens]|nr:hypothetical protein JVU11DRAFT_9623 [Chiua virens]